MCVAVGLVAAAAGASASAVPPVTDAARTLVQRIPDGKVTSGGVTRTTNAMGGLEIVGDDAYVVKGNVSGTDPRGWATLYHIDDFGKSSANMAGRTIVNSDGSPADLGHVNGLAYYRTPGTDALDVGSFYIPTLKELGATQVAQVNNQGVVTRRFGAVLAGTSTYKKIASITYYRNGTFLVVTAGENKDDPDDDYQILKPFYVARIVGSNFELSTKFYVPTTRTYDVGQDISYSADKDELLMPVWDGQNSVGTATGLKNRIVSVNLGTIKAGTTYAPDRWIQLNVSSSDASKFEVEGIDRDDDGALFVSSNILSPDGTPIDAIHKLTGK